MRKIFPISLFVFSFCLPIFGGCATPKTYMLPTEEEIQGYRIIDAIDKSDVSLSSSKNEKIAVVVRGIDTTSYSYIEPVYMNSMVAYEGRSNCCKPTTQLMGASGNTVFKFSFIGKGQTKIKLIARHKGLSETASSFDSDQVINIIVNLD